MGFAGVRLGDRGCRDVDAVPFATVAEAVAAVGEATDVYLFLIGMMLLSGDRQEAGAVRLARDPSGQACARFCQTVIPDHLRRRHPGHGVPVERRDRCGDDAGGLCSDSGRAGRSHCLISSSVLSSPTPPVLSSRSPILPTSSCSADKCRLFRNGCAILPGRHFVAILATYVGLRLMQRPALDAKVAAITGAPPLTLGGKLAAIGITLTVVVLLSASAFDRPLGLPTFCAGASLTAIVLVIGAAIAGADSQECFVERAAARCWSIRSCRGGEPNRCVVSAGPQPARCCRGPRRNRRSWIAGAVVAVASNLFNNLPAGLVAAATESCCAGAPAGGWRDTDRRRPRAQSFRDGIARHNPVADRIAPGRRET